jgi:hypothetical protein
MISDGQEKALKQILLNYANDDNASTFEAIKAITAVLGCDGGETLRDRFAMAALLVEKWADEIEAALKRKDSQITKGKQ